MSLEGLVVSVTILVIAVLWIAAPLFRRRLVQSDDTVQKQRDRLLTSYERVLNNVRDLDEDFSTGKLQAEDHDLEREQLVQRGIRILMELDKLDTAHAEHVSGALAGESGKSVDESIEEAVAAYRRKTQNAR